MEMLVSLTLFSVVTTIAFTALYRIMEANNKSKTIKLVVNNLNVAMESMTREIRVGYNYCANPPASTCDSNLGSTRIYFKTKDDCDGQYVFYSSEETIKKKVGVKDSAGNCQYPSTETAILGDDVKVKRAKFYIHGSDDHSDYNQPRVLIILRGQATDINMDTIFDIQTTVSQRNPDQ